MIRSPVALSDQNLLVDLLSSQTYPRSLLLLPHDSDTFNDRSSRIVDAIKHRLSWHQRV